MNPTRRATPHRQRRSWSGRRCRSSAPGSSALPGAGPGPDRDDPGPRQGHAAARMVPGATVTATNLGTQFSRSTTTDAGGQYALRLLPVGELQARGHAARLQDLLADGHPDRGGPQRPHRRRRSRWAASRRSSRSWPTRRSSRRARPPSSRTVGQNEVLNLPLVNRDLYSLLSITGGVSSNDTSNSLGAPGAAHHDQRLEPRPDRQRQLPARRRQQHRGPARHRQRGAEPGGGPGVPGHHQQLRRGVRPLPGGHRGHGHQVRHQPVPRRRLRVLPRREA